MYIYSLDNAKPALLRKLDKNPNTSLSGLYKRIRKRVDCESFGDVPLINFCILLFTEKNIPLSSTRIQYALSATKDYQELSKSEKLAVKEYAISLNYLPPKAINLTLNNQKLKSLQITRLHNKS